ncbi:MAG: hydrogenase iron-sulfur subunit [Lentisphaerae bacterium]|nr:hydrogenase iron-sulfur subunit [Lentisphaerota bacterium]
MMKKIVLYRCQMCGGQKKIIHEPWVREFILACGGQFEVIHALRAIEDDELGVLVAYCNPENCATLSGASILERRIAYTRTLLEEVGINSKRLKGLVCSETTDLRAELSAFCNELKDICETS